VTIPTVLFVCPDNAGSSPMAEAYLNAVAGERVRAFSAGVEPGDRVHPRAIRALAAAGLPTDGLAPKSLELFALPQAPAPDFVVVLAPAVLVRPEPRWLRPPRRLAWLLPEPDVARGQAAFGRLLAALSRHIDRALAEGVFGQAALVAGPV
jgi:arsenate reductase (thioredoxin)